MADTWHWLVAEVLDQGGQSWEDSYIHFAPVARRRSAADLRKIVGELYRRCEVSEDSPLVVTEFGREIVYVFHFVEQTEAGHDHLLAWYSDGSIYKIETGAPQGDKTPSLDLFEELEDICGGYVYGDGDVVRIGEDLVLVTPLAEPELNNHQFPGIIDHLGQVIF